MGSHKEMLILDWTNRGTVAAVVVARADVSIAEDEEVGVIGDARSR